MPVRMAAIQMPAAAAKSLQPCPTLCDPIDGSPLGFSVPGILQARILEWVAIPFSHSENENNQISVCQCLSRSRNNRHSDLFDRHEYSSHF